MYNHLNKIKYLSSIFILILFLLILNESSAFAKKRDTLFRIKDNIISAYKLDRTIIKWYPRIIYQDAEKPLWSVTFPSLKEKGKLLGPTKEIEGKIYFAYSSYVMGLDLDKAQFTDRFQLLGEITEIKDDNGKLAIKTFHGIRGKVWDKEPTIKVTPKQLEVVANLATITNRDYSSIYIKLKDAELLSENLEKAYLKAFVDNKITDPVKLELMKQEYLKAIEGDITNPWYYIYLAIINENLDKKIYSDVYFKKAIDIKGLSFYDYFNLSTFFEYINKRELADNCYDKGMSDFLNRQYTPEQLTSLQSFVNYSTWLMPAIEKLKKSKNSADVERVIDIIDRFYKLSPQKEGNFNIMNGVANYLVNMGKLQESKIWQSRAENNKGFFFTGDYSFIIADLFLNLFLASIISFIIFIIILIVRNTSEFIEDSKHNKIDLTELLRRRYISKRNIYSFVILYIFCLFSLGICNNTLASISNILKEPPTINSGTWGNYATIKYFSKEIGNIPEKNFFLALSNQQIKDYVTAISLYEKIDLPEAHNNLAVIYMKQGKKTLALDELNRALEIDKYMIEAKYNLYLLDKTKELPDDDKVKIMQKYAPNVPLISLPPDKYYKSAFYKPLSIQDFNPMNIFLFNKFLKNSGNSIIEVTHLVVPVFIAFTFTVILLLASVFIPQTYVSTANRNYLRRLLGMFIPGFSYNWNLLGPIIFALWLGLGITIFFYFGFSFEQIKPTIGLLTTFALPDYSNLAPDISSDLAFSREIGLVTSVSFSIIWLFNFFYILISRRFVQD
ncbi:MAG: tetratricopeptide repeat protein [Candidatus Sericytochromatia bacterium]